mgnify:CR=1 FL=1
MCVHMSAQVKELGGYGATNSAVDGWAKVVEELALDKEKGAKSAAHACRCARESAFHGRV